MIETFIIKSPDYSLLLDTLEANSWMKSQCPGGFFYTSPVKPLPVQKTYLYLAPLMNGGERRSDDTGLIGQNDIINIVIVGNNELASNQADLIARTAYQDIYNAYIGQPCGEVQINGITKRSESPVMFDEQHNVRTKNITLSIAYTEL